MSEKRDLAVDLELCEKATPGPWWVEGAGGIHMDGTRDGYGVTITGGRRLCRPWLPRDDAYFIAAAREGWPHAIRRAMEAEAENARLRERLEQAQAEVAALYKNLESFDVLPCVNEATTWDDPPAIDDRWIEAVCNAAGAVKRGMLDLTLSTDSRATQSGCGK